MSAKTKPAKSAARATDESPDHKMLENALGQIEKAFGRGSIMKLSDAASVPIAGIPSGALSLDVTTGTSSVTATTVAGDVTVRLPAGKGVHVKAQSVSGRLVVDGEEHKGATPGQRRVDLSTGDGACYVSANTVSGHVTVLRGEVA